MAAINDLINQIPDAELCDRIQKEVNKLAKQKNLDWSLKNICRSVHLSTICQSREDVMSCSAIIKMTKQFIPY